MAPNFKPSRVTTFKIFLSHLPDGLKPDEVRALFEPFGRIAECEVFKKNFGFVHMEEAECGRRAIEALNKTDINGKTISVVESRNEEGPNIAVTKLSVRNFPLGTTAGKIRSLFQKFGLVLECEVFRSGEAIVSMEATGDIRTAMNEMNGFQLESKPLKVEAVKLNKSGPPPYARGGPGMDPWNSNAPGPSRGPPRGRGGGNASWGGGYGPVALAEEWYSSRSGGGGGNAYYEDDYYGYDDVSPGPGPIRGRGRGGPGPLMGPRFGQRRTPYDDNAYYAEGHPVPRGRGRPGAGVQLFPGFGVDDEQFQDDTYSPGPVPLLPPKRKISRGEPYPAPPPPEPWTLGIGLGERMRNMRRSRGRGGPVPRNRGERGGKDILTQGKLQLLEALRSSGVPIPEDKDELVKYLNNAGYPVRMPHEPFPDDAGGLADTGNEESTEMNEDYEDTEDQGQHVIEDDPFAPSEAEKRGMAPQSSIKPPEELPSTSSIDFTEDIKF